MFTAGKSSIVNMLIRDRSKRVGDDAFATPVVGPPEDNVPTSADVHLYAEPNTFMTEAPIFYVDCEGLDGGESAPRAEVSKARDEPSDPGKNRQFAVDSVNRSNFSSKIRQRFTKKLRWAVGDRQRNKREFAVKQLYPRLLYTFSDVIVFVLKASRTFESAVLPNLIQWAENSIEKSLGQPILPHLVVVLNETSLSVNADQWDVKKTTELFLHDHRNALEHLPDELKGITASWRSKGKRIETTKDLLECYYSSVDIVRVPDKESYMLMHKQVAKMYNEIATKCNTSQYTKRKLRMLINGDDLQFYLKVAFDHFADTLDAPFDFIKTGRRLNPIDPSFSTNILQVSISVMENTADGRNLEKLFTRVAVMVASCIMLDMDRKRRPGPSDTLFERHYKHHCMEAFEKFYENFWPCSYQNPRFSNGRCVNVASGHKAKGHQNSDGKILADGDYVASFDKSKQMSLWLDNISQNMKRFKEFKDKAEAEGRFQDNEKVLLWIELQKCPICSLKVKTSWSGFKISTIPPLAGIRVLSLDGGGIRGIVELEVLRAIQQYLPRGIPIRAFFDLIVGTSTGGILALGLGIEEWSVDECVEKFLAFCKTAFTKRELHRVPLLGTAAAMNHEWSWYKTKPLVEDLRSSFSASDKPLFRNHRLDRSSTTKVAVTAARDTFHTPVIIANYNRALLASDEKRSALATYEFERAESDQQELLVWEAARATSAAPTYFKIHRSDRNNRGYVDGAVFHNNPIFVADQERRLIWKATANASPDIVLSIGTGKDKEISNQVTRRPSSHLRESAIDPSFHRSSHRRVTRKLRTKALLKKILDRMNDIVDAERIWQDFLSNASYRHSEDRFFRINPDLGMKPPELDCAERVHELGQKVQRVLREDPALGKTLGRVGRQLIASSFFADVEFRSGTIPDPGSHQKVFISLHCKFSQNSPEVRCLGEYFSDIISKGYRPFFILKEKDSQATLADWSLKPDIVSNMIDNARFELEKRAQDLSESTMLQLALSLKSKEELHISGFPQAILTKINTTDPTTIVDELGNQFDSDSNDQYPPHALNANCEVYHDTSGPAFRELNDLHGEAVVRVRQFVEDGTIKLSQRSRRKEEVPSELQTWLQLVSEAPEFENDAFSRGVGVDNKFILHTAAAVGSFLLMKTALDFDLGAKRSVRDQHGWTALMIAQAQQHQSCMELLLDSPSADDQFLEGDCLPPSCLVRADSEEDGIRLECDNLVVKVDEWDDILASRGQIRANHPIPISAETFYYEVDIRRTGPLHLIGIGLCRPETPTWGMPGSRKTSWGYHGDDGAKFHHTDGVGVAYSEKYGGGDTIGCGINTKAGQMFFTKNGSYLGIAFTKVRGMLFPVIGVGEHETEVKANFGSERFRYDVDAHDWTASEKSTPNKLGSPIL
ncbi:MAG: hypothetical protein M1821_008546 [Bathelium mastoideum]|nr:MAG: hypothetical protein M1821_008546 [Bathelium mastoideum]